MKHNEYLLNAIGDVDADLVERAAQKPAVKMHAAIRWVAVAAAVVMMVGVGLWAGLGGQPTPPVDVVPGDVTTQPTENPNGTGGDAKECSVHHLLYHSYDLEVVELVMTEEEFDAYIASLPPVTEVDRTYPVQECNYPESNMVDFIKKHGITREQYMQAVGYDKYIEKMGEEAFLNHRYTWLDPTEDEPTYELFTFGEYLEAIFGDDPLMTEWVFTAKASTNASSGVYYTYDWKYQYHYTPLGYYDDPLKEYLLSQEEWQDQSPYYVYKKSLDEEFVNIVDFLKFCGIDRETYIDIYGWGNKLDEKAVEHYVYAPYTYRQFVDAIYGEDETLRSWVFNRFVFHPDYPSLSDYGKLSEEDRFYAPTPVTYWEEFWQE